VFNNVHINDRGDVVFNATLGPGGPVNSGLSLVSQNAVRAVGLNVVGTSGTVGSGALNNQGDLVYVSNDGLSLLSNGSVTTLATAGQPVPNSNRAPRRWLGLAPRAQTSSSRGKAWTSCG